jgi:transposase
MGTARNVEVWVSEPAAKRRHRSKQERRQVVEETLQPGASVAVIARRHGVNANQVFHWRKLYREGRLDVEPSATHLVPVRVAEVVSGELPPARLHNGVIVEMGIGI